ncbi:NAD-dependent epimerase/dehydratase family protein [Streptomyces sp. NBC_01304]|uniref:NAD-dependent epimerase/dehydratase family protein n=1 Tax=Streptomyces sp. NBC_01304 TaxID=2903818 RepID=UPI002E146647|nr:NAD-dependent epimerase/dehydratase family protein [Streptomyces sp. NBC_01304]
MRLLLLGGTEFAGRAVTEAALARGWEVTVFHRGRHEAPAGVTALHGDRMAEGGLGALADGEWDVVVDTWSAAPTAIRDAARLLAGRVGRYVYVSSNSVYAWPPSPGYDESAPVTEGSADAEQVAYAEDKRGGELAVLRESGEERSLLVRSGLIIGPYENIGRLPWWLNRVARGGPVLAPGPRDLALQYIDVRDLAEWILDASEAGLSGPYNLAGPQGHTTIGELLEACVQVAGAADAELRWTSPEVIAAAGIQPWMQLPVWVPPGGELYAALHSADVGKAVEAGLVCRPVRDTVADTWTWLQAIGGTPPQRPDRPVVGLPADLEAKVLGG